MERTKEKEVVRRYGSDLTDEQWEQVRPFVARKPGPGLGLTTPFGLLLTRDAGC